MKHVKIALSLTAGAIFMAYIGFNGVISSQFGKFHSTDSEMVLLTTNGTALQPGFYFFVYAVLALFLSEFLNKRQLQPLREV